MKVLNDLLAGMRASVGILADFVEAIPREKLHLRRGEGFWTIAEHIDHLAQVQPMLLSRIETFAQTRQPEFVPYLPGDEPPAEKPAALDIPTALKAFGDYRGRQIEQLKSLSSDIWQRTAIHPEYERYSLPILARHILMHDYWHMYRMEELWLTKDAYLTRVSD
jgi:uncharacterized damage-inducible protein DinB